jgi:hypothetical protein
MHTWCCGTGPGLQKTPRVRRWGQISSESNVNAARHSMHQPGCIPGFSASHNPSSIAHGRSHTNTSRFGMPTTSSARILESGYARDLNTLSACRLRDLTCLTNCGCVFSAERQGTQSWSWNSRSEYSDGASIDHSPRLCFHLSENS